MKLLIVLEDFAHDQHVVKPVVRRALAEAGLSARVDVLYAPRLRGAEELLDPDRLANIVRDNPMTDLFVLALDRDCDRARHTARATAREAAHEGRVLTILAVEEVEVWMLALHRDALGVAWTEVRRECDPKERFAEPFLRARWSRLDPGAGRRAAMENLAGQWKPLASLCPEVGALVKRRTVWRE